MWNCQIFFCSSIAWKSYLNDISLSFLFGDLSNYHLICSQTLPECLTDASVLKCPKLNLWYLFPKPVFLWVSTFQHQPHLTFPALQGQTLRIFFNTSCTLPQPILSSLLEKYIQCEFNLFSPLSLPPPDPSHHYFLPGMWQVPHNCLLL